MEATSGPRQLAAGTMLDDKYRIESLLAVGGMGAVYVGTHIKLRKKVAIKVLNPQISTPPMIARFHREAIMASQIGHEGIAQVTDLGTSTAGEAFLVMEFLDGESLARRLKTTGPLPVELACELGCAILSPLAAAHHAGVVHRDLKPDNVFLVKQSRGEIVKLLDFGISRAAGLEGELKLTSTGVVMGTPFYMSPEQARGDNEVSAAADLYSFGVILYEMLIGHVPITGENYNQLMFRVMTGEYVRPRQLRPDLPEALENIIVRAMALVPETRPSSAVELEQALLGFCRSSYRDHMIQRISGSGIPWGTPPPLTPSGFGNASASLNQVGVVGVTQGTDPTLVAPSEMRARARRSKLPFILAGALVVGGGIATVAAVASRSNTAKPDEHVVTAPAPSPTPGPPPTTAPPTTATAPPTTAPPTTATAPPTTAPAAITLRFSVNPTGATITLDGKPAAAEQTVAKDDAEHTLVISAPGYKPHTETLHFDDNQKLVIELDRVAARPTGTHKPERPKKPDRIESESPYK